MRGLFDFDDRLVHTGPASENAQAKPEAKHWKVKPTMPAEAFQVNPNPGEGGVYMDQVTVVFESSVTDAEITSFNAAIGAVVVIAPVRSHAWRMKIPPTINLEQAIDYYKAWPVCERRSPVSTTAPRSRCGRTTCPTTTSPTTR